MDDAEYSALAGHIRARMSELEAPLLHDAVLRVTYSNRSFDRSIDESPATESLALIDALSQQIALEDQATLDSAIERLNQIARPESPITRVVITSQPIEPGGPEVTSDLRASLADMSQVRAELRTLQEIIMEDDRF
jgi:hypothetical protein